MRPLAMLVTVWKSPPPESTVLTTGVSAAVAAACWSWWSCANSCGSHKAMIGGCEKVKCSVSAPCARRVNAGPKAVQGRGQARGRVPNPAGNLSLLVVGAELARQPHHARHREREHDPGTGARQVAAHFLDQRDR